jgi:hypothetical protein
LFQRFLKTLPLTDRGTTNRTSHGEERSAAGLVAVTVAGGRGARADQISCCCDGTLSSRRRFGSKGPQRRSGDEIALKVEIVVDRSAIFRKRWAELPDLNLCICRACRRTIWGKFSARLFAHSPRSCGQVRRKPKSGSIRAQLVCRQ